MLILLLLAENNKKVKSYSDKVQPTFQKTTICFISMIQFFSYWLL